MRSTGIHRKPTSRAPKLVAGSSLAAAALGVMPSAYADTVPSHTLYSGAFKLQTTASPVTADSTTVNVFNVPTSSSEQLKSDTYDCGAGGGVQSPQPGYAAHCTFTPDQLGSGVILTGTVVSADNLTTTVASKYTPGPNGTAGTVALGPNVDFTAVPGTGDQAMTVTVDTSATSAVATGATLTGTTVDCGVQGVQAVFGPTPGIATCTYASAVTPIITVTATDSNGVSSSRQAQPIVPSTVPLAYVGRIGEASAVAAGSTRAGMATTDTAEGDAILISVYLTDSKPGPVTILDGRTNDYRIVSDVTDATKHRTIVFAAFNTRHLQTNEGTDAIVVNFPSSSKYEVTADEFSGVESIDQSATATGPAGGTVFTTAPATTTAQDELLFSAVGTNSGTPAKFDTGWTTLPSVALSSYKLTSGYQIVHTTGTYSASGTTTGAWTAAMGTFK